MKLDVNAIISDDKITKYLLVTRVLNDKSEFLAIAGYELSNWQQLKLDIKEQILPLDATLDETTSYGDKYKIKGTLTGPNGNSLEVITVWMIEYNTGLTKFITLFPDKEARE